MATYLSVGQAAALLGVCSRTLRRWDRSGAFRPDFRTLGNHRRYGRARVLSAAGKREPRAGPAQPTRCALYGRVSSSRQKKSGDLQRQLAGLAEHSRVLLLLEDVLCSNDYSNIVTEF